MSSESSGSFLERIVCVAAPLAASVSEIRKEFGEQRVINCMCAECQAYFVGVQGSDCFLCGEPTAPASKGDSITAMLPTDLSLEAITEAEGKEWDRILRTKSLIAAMQLADDALAQTSTLDIVS